MKKLIAVIFSVIIILLVLFLSFEYTYRLSPEKFITDRTTFIYSNKNLTDEKMQKIVEVLNIKGKEEKELLKRVKSIYILSQSKIYSGNINGVGIIDTDKYYPLMLIKLKEFFDYRDDYFYQLKDEYKKELGMSDRENLYLKPYRGLFFLSNDIENIERTIHGNGKMSTKTIEAINEGQNYNFGVFVLNQERERLLGIDRVAVYLNIDEDNAFVDGYIYGDNELIKQLGMQPENRNMEKYIRENTIYISTLNLKKMDTFILRGISLHSGEHMKEMIRELFSSNFSDIFLQLSGEMLIDIENGNYIFGLKQNEKVDEVVEYFKDNDKINLVSDENGNYYIVIGENTFVSGNNTEKIAKNQFISGKYQTRIGSMADEKARLEIKVDGFYEENRLKIESKLKWVIK